MHIFFFLFQMSCGLILLTTTETTTINPPPFSIQVSLKKQGLRMRDSRIDTYLLQSTVKNGG